MIKLQATQASILSYEKGNAGTTTYHLSTAIEIRGPLNVNALKTALLGIMARHEVLRSCIADSSTGCHLQVIAETLALPFQQLDASHLGEVPPVQNLCHTLQTLSKADFIEAPFELESELLWRAALIQYREDRHQFIMLFHHIMIDQHSINVLLKEISTYYNAALSQSTPDLPSLPSLKDISFELDPLKKTERLSYWESQLADLNTVTLHTDYASKNNNRYQGKRVSFQLERTLIDQLTSKNQPFSLNTVLLATLHTLLYQLSSENDLCIGITSSNRRHDEKLSREISENLVNGFFNSVPIRVRFDENKSFHDLLLQVQTTIKDGLKNQLPIDTLFQEALSPKIKAALHTASPFHVMFALNQKKPTLTLTNTTASYPIEVDLGSTKFHYFGINCNEQYDGSYDCFLEYNTQLFKPESITRFIEHFQLILKTIAINPKIKVMDIIRLSKDEVELIAELNDTHETLDDTDLVHHALHQAAITVPDKTAVIFHDTLSEKQSLTYRELDAAASGLAAYLLKISNKPHQTIGICLERGLPLVVALYGSLKAGGTFVTLDTEQNNLPHTLKNFRFSSVIVSDQTKHLFSGVTDVSIIHYNDINQYILENSASPDYQPPSIEKQDIAYVMFTSGTTGTPKAAELTHAGFANLLEALRLNTNIAAHTKIISTALPTFDAFFYDMLVALAKMGELHLTSNQNRFNPTFIEQIIRHENIAFGAFLPQLLDQLNPEIPLKYIITMGAPPHPDTLNRWLATDPTRRIENGLGHTETGICLSTHPYHSDDDPMLIGRPICNMQVFILNPHHLSLCPPNTPGEIFVAGPGVATGYKNNELLTKKHFVTATFDKATQRFIPCDPADPSAIRLYKSGDRACYQFDRHNQLNLKLIGRLDRQVKMYGVRVELNEIERILRQSEKIKGVTVLSNEDQTALTAHVEPMEPAILAEEIRAEVRTLLSQAGTPRVAIPKNITLLSTLPINPNGKINKAALPASANQPLFPANREETPMMAQLRSIWANVLSHPEAEIDLDTSFEDLGGNSLQLAKLATAIKNLLPIGQNKMMGMNLLSSKMSIASLAGKLQAYSQTMQMIRQPLYSNSLFTPGFQSASNSNMMSSKDEQTRTDQTIRPGSPPIG